MMFYCNQVTANESRYISERRFLAKKYTDIPNVEIILLPKLESQEDYALYYKAINDLNKDESKHITEFLIDLLDYNHGEITNRTIYYIITTRKRDEAVPLLKTKLLSVPLSSELEINYRNTLIVDLIRMIINNVKHICPGDSRPSNEEKQIYAVYSFQMWLEKYFQKNGIYPKSLSEHESAILGNVKYEYRSIGQNYFLRFTGPDGIFDSNDDPKLPFEQELHCFPGKEDF